MKILVYGINYYPELTGIGKYTTEMCEWLAQQGHQVEVITALPYYPEWEVHEAYRGKGWCTEAINGVKVHRGPFYVPREVSGYTRLMHDFSFMMSSTWNWLKTLPRNFDAVVCVYPPLPTGIFPLIYKWLKGTPFVFHVQDLQVDAARQLDIIRRKSLLNFLEGFERFFMQRAALVTTISRGMKQKILNKGINPEKLRLFPNWVDTKQLFPYDPRERGELKEKYGYQSWDKVVLYSGNLGEKQGLDTLLRTAALAQQQQKDIKFRIVGEGAVKRKLLALAETLQLKNVDFAPLVPKSELPDLLNMADLHVILQKKGATDLVMPSKLSGILACGGIPLVAAEEESSLRQEIERFRMGVTTDAENELALLHAIEQHLQADEEAKNQLQANASYFARHHLSMEGILPQFEEQLFEAAGKLVIKNPKLQTAEVYRL